MNTSSNNKSRISRLPLGIIGGFLIALVYSLIVIRPCPQFCSVGGKSLPVDTAAYNIGAENALDVFSLRNDSVFLNLSLLEVRARQWSIHTKFGEAASESYLLGFQEKLTELSDSLARILF